MPKGEAECKEAASTGLVLAAYANEAMQTNFMMCCLRKGTPMKSLECSVTRGQEAVLARLTQLTDQACTVDEKETANGAKRVSSHSCVLE